MNEFKGNVYTRKHRGELDEIVRANLMLLKIKDKLKLRPKHAKSIKDVEFVVDSWGKLSKEEIAQKLNTTIDNVNNIATRIGLKNFKLYTNYLSLVDIQSAIHHKIVKRTDINYNYFKKLLKQYNAPIVSLKFNKEAYNEYIDEAEFFNWYKEHLTLLDIYNYDNSLNAPDWFIEKAEADKRAYAYTNKRQWTNEEKETVINMINKGCGYREISIKLKRTGDALKRFFTDNKIKIRPKKAYNQIKWTKEEINKVKELYLKGYKPCIIQEEMDRSDLAIDSILQRYNYFGNKNLRFSK